MILPFLFCSKWRQKVRHKLILGLGISDISTGMCLFVYLKKKKKGLLILMEVHVSLMGSTLIHSSLECIDPFYTSLERWNLGSRKSHVSS